MSDVDPALVGPPESAAAPDTPPAPAETSVATLERGAHAAENVVDHPGLSSLSEAIDAGEELAASPTADVLASEVPALMQESKAGYKTTEFWGAAAAVLSDVVTSLPHNDKILVTALAAVYAIARGLAKNGTPNITPVVPE